MMSKMFKIFLPAALAVTALSAYGQAAPTATPVQRPFYKLNNADMGVAITGQYTSSITSQNLESSGTTLPHQATTDSPGVLVTLRDSPFRWAAMEFNYQFTKYQQRYFVVPTGANPHGNANAPVFVNNYFHEATADFLVHLPQHYRHVSPFLGVGGGYIDFLPVAVGSNQWRGTGLVNLGFDAQTSSRLGFRVGARSLLYRAPDFGNGVISSSRWVATAEPYVGVYVKF